MLDDDSPNGAVGCFVPHSPLSVGGAQMNYAGKGFAPANKSCDASWASAYPSAVYSVMRTVSRQSLLAPELDGSSRVPAAHRCGQEGDTSIARRNWAGLKRFIDNEIHRATQNSSLGLRNML